MKLTEGVRMKFEADRVGAGRAAPGIRLGFGGQQGVACLGGSGRLRWLPSLHHLSHLLGREGHQVLEQGEGGGEVEGWSGRARQGGNERWRWPSCACCCWRHTSRLRAAAPAGTGGPRWSRRSRRTAPPAAAPSARCPPGPARPAGTAAAQGRAGVGGCGDGGGAANCRPTPVQVQRSALAAGSTTPSWPQQRPPHSPACPPAADYNRSRCRAAAAEAAASPPAAARCLAHCPPRWPGTPGSASG